MIPVLIGAVIGGTVGVISSIQKSSKKNIEKVEKRIVSEEYVKAKLGKRKEVVDK